MQEILHLNAGKAICSERAADGGKPSQTLVILEQQQPSSQ
jgi:hypothetical protein